MTGEVTIQWCPSCQAWNRSKQVGVDILSGHAAGGVEPIAFDYRREDRSCESCNSEFITTSLESCEPQHRWHAQAELGNIRKALVQMTALGAGHDNRPSRDSRHDLGEFPISALAG